MNNDASTQLSCFRAELDEIDSRMVELFIHRMNVCRQIGNVKRMYGLPVENGSREEEVLAAVETQLPPTLRSYGRELFLELFRLSKNYQSCDSGTDE